MRNLRGTVKEFTETKLWVVDTDGEAWLKRLHLLPSECLIPVRVGMTVELEYRTGASYGRWVIIKEVTS